jgi:hypothetical protein
MAAPTGREQRGYGWRKDTLGLPEGERTGTRRPSTSRRGVGLAVVSWLLLASARGATWYVDNTAGGTGDGTSWANAWKSFAGITWSKISAGDTLYLSGGATSQTYYETLTVQRSGSSASRLLIQVGQTAGHNGQVIIDAQGARAACIELGSSQYVTLSGNNGLAATNLVLRNATSSASRYTGVGINSSSPTGETIEYVEVDTCNNGINLVSGPGNVVRYSYLHAIMGDHAIVLNGTDAYDNCQVYNSRLQLNQASNGQGPDGVQGGNGITVRDCLIYSAVGTVVAGQHMDAIQPIGNHWKIYNNYIRDMGNACIEGGSVGSSWNSVMVYNNIFTATANTSWPRGFEFSPNSAITSVNGIYVVNNTFVDLNFRAIWWGSWANSGASISLVQNVVIQNNIFYNCDHNDSMLVDIEAIAGISQGAYQFDYNAINAGAAGQTAVVINGASYSQPHPRTAAPRFLAYAQYAAGNDFHLAATDTTCKDTGTDGSAWMPAVDKDGTTRPQGPAWDIGAYELSSGGGGNTNSPPTVSVISQDVPDADALLSGLQVYAGTTVHYSGSASDPNGNPITWQWIYAVNGGAETVLQSGTGAVVRAGYTYPSNAVGSSYAWKLRVSDGLTTNESSLVVGVKAAPSAAGTLTFDASSGALSGPFTVGAGYIYQAAQVLDTTNSGRAAYSFTLTNAGSYVVGALVNAPGTAANSLYVNIDAEPQDPLMIWDIPVTSGFEQRFGAWRGNGTSDSDQFAPKVFILAAGSHQLIVRGREPNVQLAQLSIVKLPPPPQNLRVVPVP